MTLVQDFVKNAIPANWRSNPTGWTSGNCPMCIENGESRPDTKGRGGFLFEEEKFRYNCFNCGYTTGHELGKPITTRLKRLLYRFGVDESDVQRLQLALMQEEDVATMLLKKQKREAPVIINWKEIVLPEGATPLNDYTGGDTGFIKAVEYLHSRGFDVTDDRLWYSPAKSPARMASRFIIPFLYKGKAVGYTARWIGKPPDGMPKYYNQQPSGNFVYGLDRQLDKNVVIVTEGQLDAIVTDGVAIGSNNINDDQANIIDRLNKRIVVLPDADQPGMRMVNTAIERGWGVAFPDWEDCKDASDAVQKYGRLYTVRGILDSTITNTTKIKVMAKGYCR
jgi:hypothetical protein